MAPGVSSTGFMPPEFVLPSPPDWLVLVPLLLSATQPQHLLPLFIFSHTHFNPVLQPPPPPDCIMVHSESPAPSLFFFPFP